MMGGLTTEETIMTLRLVNDNSAPDETLYCRHGSCRHYGPGRGARPATVLVTFLDHPPLPSCDDCARSTWENHPQSTLISPLAGYVDMFAAAKDAALATPEQVIASAPAPAPAPVAAPARAHRSKAARTRTIPAQGWGITAGISLVLGIVLCLAGAPDGTQIGSEPNIPMIITGIPLILAGIVTGLIAIFKALDEHDKRNPARQAAAVPAQQQYADGSYQQGIPVGQLAMTALPWVALGIAEHRRRVHHQQAVAGVQAHAAQYRAEAAQQQRDATQNAILGELQSMNNPGPAYGNIRRTPHSDIYGNLV
jgi:hypothetical protein